MVYSLDKKTKNIKIASKGLVMLCKGWVLAFPMN